MNNRPITEDPNVFVVWDRDDIDSSFYEDTDDPQPLYVALLCVDSDDQTSDLVRGYDPSDGMFERPGKIVASLGGIDTCRGEYAREVEDELYAEFQAKRDAAISRGEN